MIDLSDFLTDTDFGAEWDLLCIRNKQDVDEHGRAKVTRYQEPFAGVVTEINTRTNSADGAYPTGSITIHTQVDLWAADEALQHDADIIQRGDGRQYVVTEAQNYIRNGVGFVVATCEPRRSKVSA